MSWVGLGSMGIGNTGNFIKGIIKARRYVVGCVGSWYDIMIYQKLLQVVVFVLFCLFRFGLRGFKGVWGSHYSISVFLHPLQRYQYIHTLPSTGYVKTD